MKGPHVTSLPAQPADVELAFIQYIEQNVAFMRKP